MAELLTTPEQRDELARIKNERFHDYPVGRPRAIADLLTDFTVLAAENAALERSRNIAEMQVRIFADHWATRVGECEVCLIMHDCPLCEADWNENTQTMLQARCVERVKKWAYDKARAALAQPQPEVENV